jgi:hydrogenase maturation factor
MAGPCFDLAVIVDAERNDEAQLSQGCYSQTTFRIDLRPLRRDKMTRDMFRATAIRDATRGGHPNSMSSPY